jgi:hypothetical protein
MAKTNVKLKGKPKAKTSNNLGNKANDWKAGTNKLRKKLRPILTILRLNKEMDDHLKLLIKKSKAIMEDKKQGPKTKMDLGGDQIREAGSVHRAATEVRSGSMLKTPNGWAKFVTTYLNAFKAGQELGHINASIATLKVANLLSTMDSKDPLRSEIEKYYSYLKKIDALTEKDFKKGSLKETVDITSNLLTKTQVKTKIKTDIDLMQGIGKTQLIVAYEARWFNQAKATLAQGVMHEVNNIMLGAGKSIKGNIKVQEVDFIREEIKESLIAQALGKKPKRKSKKTQSKRYITNRDPLKDLKTDIKKQETESKRTAALLRSHRPEQAEPEESGQSFASLVQLLNAKLPQTVGENMGLPGLVYRSGRFANSVRVTDVIPTAQGYPSIGYTYQKDPYQVFEMGAGAPPWATPARDPRKLIDASIREIAQELAVGRFYTRRV